MLLVVMPLQFNLLILGSVTNSLCDVAVLRQKLAQFGVLV